MRVTQERVGCSSRPSPDISIALIGPAKLAVAEFTLRRARAPSHYAPCCASGAVWAMVNYLRLFHITCIIAAVTSPPAWAGLCPQGACMLAVPSSSAEIEYLTWTDDQPVCASRFEALRDDSRPVESAAPGWLHGQLARSLVRARLGGIITCDDRLSMLFDASDRTPFFAVLA